jgi:hypothetical protein
LLERPQADNPRRTGDDGKPYFSHRLVHAERLGNTVLAATRLRIIACPFFFAAIVVSFGESARGKAEHPWARAFGKAWTRGLP